MMKNLIKSLTLFLFLGLSLSALAQKKPYLTDPQEIEDQAKATLEEMMSPNGAITKYAKKNELKGSYTFDIAIWNKGQVSTVRPVSRDGDISTQNEIKDLIMGIKFPMKLPKNQQYKFQYEFKF